MTASPEPRSISAVRSGELNGWFRIGVPFVHLLTRLFFRVKVVGIEHVPSSGPGVLVFNHVSVLDGLAVAAEMGWRLKREVRFLVASENFAKFFVGWAMRAFEQIPVRRGQGDAAAVEQAVITVRHGALAALAPEGRVDDHAGAEGLQRIKSGVARIALATGAPVVPVGIWGTQERWPRGGLTLRRPFRPRLALAFGAPILPLGDVGNPQDLDAFRERVRERLEEQVAQARRLVGEAV